MANIFDYLAWRGDIDFLTAPFNPVDNVIFSQLSYLTFDDIVPGPEEKDGISIDLAAKIYNEKINNPSGKNIIPMFKEDPDLLHTMASTKRFRDCQLFGYVNHINTDREIQFSAICIHTGDGSCFIVFRGTDASVIGWKEDFNMSFKEAIPSQLEAVNYLEKMAPKISGPLRIGGHSKGGNLAIYASSFCNKKIQQRITEIYNNDAPGFHKKIISSEGFNEIKNRIHFYIPQSSIIGMFFEHGSDYTVVKSTENGIMQHFLYSWEVTHNDLIRVEDVTNTSRFVNKTLQDWLGTLDNAQREQFIEALYSLLNDADIKSFEDLEKTWISSAGRMIKSFSNTDESTRKLLINTFGKLFFSAGRNIENFWKQEHHNKNE